MSEGQATILAALHEVMGKVGYVQKKGKNSFQNYKYAGEGNLLEVLRPAMVEAGLILIPSHREVSKIDENGITTACVEYTLAHKSGAVWPEKIVVYGAGHDKNKNGVGDKGLYKALTGANKYLLFKLFQIETGDDPEKDSDHDKDDGKPETNVKTITQKDAPGITKFAAECRDQCREVMSCPDVDSLMALLGSPQFKKFAVKSCGEFPSTWTGPEEFSGLRGMIEKAGKQLGCEDRTTPYIVAVENAARKQVQQAAE